MNHYRTISTPVISFSLGQQLMKMAKSPAQWARDRRKQEEIDRAWRIAGPSGQRLVKRVGR
jgi:hypothetical protein